MFSFGGQRSRSLDVSKLKNVAQVLRSDSLCGELINC